MAMRQRMLSLAVAALLIIPLAMAANYTVGGPGGGWDQSTNLQSWASSQSFAVGDNLGKYYDMNSFVVCEMFTYFKMVA